jgi:spore coat protein CotH
MINGEFVGTTPLNVDFYVDHQGRVMREIQMRAISPEPMVVQEIRTFPAAATDGDASRIPHIIDFDLNIQPVLVIR